MSTFLPEASWNLYLSGTLGAVLLGLWQFLWKPRLERRRPFDDLPTPCPHGHWLFGHVSVAAGASSLEEFYEKLLGNRDDRGRVGLYLFTWKVVAVTEWSDTRRVLYAEHHHRVVQPVKKHLVKFLGPHNIGFLNDRLWKHERAVVLKALATLQPTVSTTVHHVVSTLVASLRQRIHQISNKTMVLDVVPLMKMVTLDVFGRVAFSHSFECCADLRESPVAAAFSFLGSDLTRRLMTGPLWPTNYLYNWPTWANRRHAKSSRVLRQFLADRIAERKHPSGDMAAQSSPDDLLSSLLLAHQGMGMEKTQNIPLDDLMSDVLLSLLFAGYDTTSIALAYVLYVVSKYPDVAKHCRQEISTRGLDHAEELVYCRAVLQETLRLYPPPYTTQRWLQKDVALPDGYVIPAGTLVMCPIWYIHRCAQNFERPTEFRPDRWVRQEGTTWVTREPEDEKNHDDETLPNISPGNPQAFFAFSAGARSCPGQSFAWSEALIVMANLLHHFDFSLLPGHVLQPDRHGIVQQPKGGLSLKITPPQEEEVSPDRG